jgi:hypothetical protein
MKILSNASAEQVAICARFQSEIDAPMPGERVGIALATLSQLPLNALRHNREGGVCGWYIWGGEEMPNDPEFFQALCVEHLPDHASPLIPYLALAPGWRVLLAPEYEDVWFDSEL